ncbi:trigger factor [Microbacter margulisiae]|uniref:Trigger factor n=1 Tax=Microbacter margulisiae TaxID=1350067 RepID=A0A7W5DQM7_9PORP|nr:trigger factor [Microbacter margulisiae]MBB3187289.1 trigger factor [Microbacter margulisiae]
MNIVRKDTDALNAQLYVQISSTDYAEKVEKTLKEYKRKANVPGFRPGMVPVGLLKKMYGKAILAEEVNKIVSEALDNYIRENNLNLLGEILPNETNQGTINFDTDESFEFVFDFAVAPEINLELSKNDSISYYNIEINGEMIDEHIQSLQNNLGSNVDSEIVEEKDLITGSLEEISGATEKYLVEEANISSAFLKEEQKALFIGKKIGDVITFNPLTAFVNEQDAATLLNVEKENIANFASDFIFTIQKISHFQPHPLDQEFFDLVYGKEVVSSETEAREKEKESIQVIMEENSLYRFEDDARAYVLNQLTNVAFPEAFLKRWLLKTNKDITEEIIEKEFSGMLDVLKWQLFRNQLAVKNEIKVEQQDLESYAKRMLKAQYAQYGITNFPEDLLAEYAKETLKKEGQAEKYFEAILNEKVAAAIKEMVTLNVTLISFNNFQSLPRI